MSPLRDVKYSKELQSNHYIIIKVCGFCQTANGLFHCVYLMEYLLRICVDPRGYWRSPLNVLSAFVLLLSSVCMTLSVSLKHLVCIYVLLVFRLRNYTDVEQVVM